MYAAASQPSGRNEKHASCSTSVKALQPVVGIGVEKEFNPMLRRQHQISESSATCGHSIHRSHRYPLHLPMMASVVLIFVWTHASISCADDVRVTLKGQGDHRGHAGRIVIAFREPVANAQTSNGHIDYAQISDNDVDYAQTSNDDIDYAQISSDDVDNTQTSDNMQPADAAVDCRLSDMTGTTLTPIERIGIRLKPEPGALPKDCFAEAYPTAESGEPEDGARTTGEYLYQWTASGLAHHPLYFEDVSLERYGHTRPFQPAVSGIQFYANVLALPYKAGVDAPRKCIYTLGYQRPGNCVNPVKKCPPLSLKGAILQAGAATGFVFLFP